MKEFGETILILAALGLVIGPLVWLVVREYKFVGPSIEDISLMLWREQLDTACAQERVWVSDEAKEDVARQAQARGLEPSLTTAVQLLRELAI